MTSRFEREASHLFIGITTIGACIFMASNPGLTVAEAVAATKAVLTEVVKEDETEH